jgi:D-glycero-D-manno-heptose 1,7-bisphosphate phosphatase
MRPGVFLDRDGTINEQMGYINHISRFHLLPGVGPAIRLLNEHNIPAVVVSNQSGLARGYFPPELLTDVNGRMEELLAAEGARLDGIYVCPHHPAAEVTAYRMNCDCRKPKTGLFTQAALELDIDLARSYVVGDRWSDVRAAANCGATSILVLTGYGRGELAYIGPEQETQPRFVAEDLQEAARWILKDLSLKEIESAGAGAEEF